MSLKQCILDLPLSSKDLAQVVCSVSSAEANCQPEAMLPLLSPTATPQHFNSCEGGLSEILPLGLASVVLAGENRRLCLQHLHRWLKGPVLRHTGRGRAETQHVFLEAVSE